MTWFKLGMLFAALPRAGVCKPESHRTMGKNWAMLMIRLEAE